MNGPQKSSDCVRSAHVLKKSIRGAVSDQMCRGCEVFLGGWTLVFAARFTYRARIFLRYFLWVWLSILRLAWFMVHCVLVRVMCGFVSRAVCSVWM